MIRYRCFVCFVFLSLLFQYSTKNTHKLYNTSQYNKWWTLKRVSPAMYGSSMVYRCCCCLLMLFFVCSCLIGFCLIVSRIFQNGLSPFNQALTLFILTKYFLLCLVKSTNGQWIFHENVIWNEKNNPRYIVIVRQTTKQLSIKKIVGECPKNPWISFHWNIPLIEISLFVFFSFSLCCLINLCVAAWSLIVESIGFLINKDITRDFLEESLH